MKFSEVVSQTVAWLQREGRVSYVALQREFGLDDQFLEDIKTEIIEAKRLAVDENGKILVWTGTPGEEAGDSARTRAEGPEVPPTLRFTLPTAPPEAQRRPLTVMFCDVVGSTALSTQLDPEELREVLRAYQAACAGVIQRYEGYIAQYLGDGLLAYFGYPTAHEDSARRAVQTGLGIVEAIQALNSELHSPLQVRIGIHTGPVVVGHLGAGEKREELALGETPNLAARLQGVAEPDTVVISAATRRLVAGFFECQDLGPRPLKGFATSVPIYRVVREGEALSRLEVAAQHGLTPLVGRKEEVSLLLRHWARANEGEGQVVLLCGEAGIGKSRLVQVVKEEVVRQGATPVEFLCSSYHQNSALYPIIEHLRRLLRFRREDTPQSKLAKLEGALAAYHFPQADTLPLLAALLSLPHPQNFPPLTLSPQKQKEKTHEALIAWILEEASRQAVYCAWEDLHWADPSTLELLQLFLELVPTMRLFALLTCRPEFRSPWERRTHINQLTLSRLGRTHVMEMTEKVTGGKALPPEVLQQIVAKTDGVPLFVEELTKMVLESGLLREEEGRYVGARDGMPIPSLAIPTTLHDALVARLDRLTTVREVVQLGATLGREFSYELIEAVAPLDEATLRSGLQRLVDAELLYQQGLVPQARYLFKHALIQDAAYQSLLKSKRQQYHEQIAQVLEARFPEIKETQPELVAHHYTQAGLVAQSIPYWQRAGQRAIARSAHVEAITHLTAGIELLKPLPDTPERTQQELMLQTVLGPALMAMKGYGAPEVEKAYARALELCRQVGETPRLLQVLSGLGTFYFTRGQLQMACELREQCLRLAQETQTRTRLPQAHLVLATSLFYLGELVPAREHMEQAVALYDFQYRRPQRAFQDPGIDCLSYMALILWCLGYPDQALERSRQALALAQELSHPFSSVVALVLAAWLHYVRREGDIVQERAQAAMTLSTEQGFSLWSAFAAIFCGGVLAEQGQGAEGIVQMRRGLADSWATGAEVTHSLFLAMLAEGYKKAGQIEEGLKAVADALGMVEKNGERFWEAELYRLRGELLLSQPPVQGIPAHGHNAESEAEQCFLRALGDARHWHAKSLELRAAMSLSRLWQRQGKKKEAHDALSEVYGRFTEGFDTKDLQETQVLLRDLD